MDIRLDPQEVTYANIAMLKLTGERIAVGVELSLRGRAEDGRTLHTPYKVMSMIYEDLKTPSIRQAIPTICCDILAQVSRDTKLVNFRCGNPHFQKYRSLESTVGLFAMERGIDVRFNHIYNLHVKVPNIAKLCEDAIRRGSSVISAV